MCVVNILGRLAEGGFVTPFAMASTWNGCLVIVSAAASNCKTEQTRENKVTLLLDFYIRLLCSSA